MNSIVNDMSECIKAIVQIPTKTAEGHYITNAKSANMISGCIVKFAGLFEGCSDDLYKYLTDLPNKFFVAQIEPFFGTRTGDYVINNVHLGYLDAIVDTYKMGLFKSNSKAPKIFISHSAKDIEYITAFVDMLERFGIKKEYLFCSSIDGYKIPLGANIYDYLRDQFEGYNLYVILMLSDNYYESYACLNEMGAAWALRAEHQAILLPKFTFKNIGGAIDPRNISFRLDDERERLSRLTELKEKIVAMFELHYDNGIIWERHKLDFISKVDKVTADIETRKARIDDLNQRPYKNYSVT